MTQLWERSEEMPFWNFFAFNADSASELMLLPAQQAIRARDLKLWQKVFIGLFAKHSPKALLVGEPDLSMDSIPEESDFTLRRNLQFFVENLADHHLQGNFPRARNWVCHEISWPAVLRSQAEVDEIEEFQANIIARQLKAPDPFWCLESNSGVDSNYVSPAIVKAMAERETTVGLFRRLARRTDLNPELKALSADLAAVGSLIRQAAREDLALYFRNDGT